MALKKEPKGKRANFTLNAPEAKEVSLAGSFNDWNSKNMLLKKGKDNKWNRELTLKPGRYEYKFVVDGNWISDPSNKNRVANSLGTDNSIIEIS